MKRIPFGRILENVLTVALFALMGCALVACIPGCKVQQPPTTQPVFTPAQQLILATETLSDTLAGLANARDLGIIKQSDIDPYRPYVDSLLAIRAAAERDLRAGNVSNEASYIHQIQAGLDAIQPLLLKVAQAKAAASTRPTH